ncbi:hypothetical protein EYC84_002805 [Monilinia fructicola]|uniref:Uncharacterized protein n=1 Tax=Monilinia fructicola TaxID=38448 RepID=A0A5M9JMQ5_MONFR|nr:hypothetical protein EYC84_002805 [Monilinia fructicola]
MAEHSHPDLLDAMELIESFLGHLNLFSSSDLPSEFIRSLLYIHLKYLGCTSVSSDVPPYHFSSHLISALHDSHTSYDHSHHDTSTHLYEFNDQILDELSRFPHISNSHHSFARSHFTISTFLSGIPHISVIVPASAFCVLRSAFSIQHPAFHIPPMSIPCPIPFPFPSSSSSIHHHAEPSQHPRIPPLVSQASHVCTQEPIAKRRSAHCISQYDMI